MLTSKEGKNGPQQRVRDPGGGKKPQHLVSIVASSAYKAPGDNPKLIKI